MDSSTIAIQFEGVSRHFGAIKAVDEISFEVFGGEFFTMLGPSGSGKTTCLRLIAGFEQPSAGHIKLYGKAMEGTPPYDRDVNTVFQDYALFPHMNVGANIGYGLRIKKVPGTAIQQQVEEMLEMVRLPGITGRKVSQLSGGQQQRVALARALINKPRVLLLDEPLGALDLKLRQEMQVELKTIQKQVGITFIFVTHDQEEALTMSDRIAVFNQGKIAQIGTPTEIYEHPRTRFVAGFVGTMNLLAKETAQAITGEARSIAVRPEKIRLCREDETPPDNSYSVRGVVEDVIYLGVNTRYVVRLDNGEVFTVLQQNLEPGSLDVSSVRGSQVKLVWNKTHTLILDEEV